MVGGVVMPVVPCRAVISPIALDTNGCQRDARVGPGRVLAGSSPRLERVALSASHSLEAALASPSPAARIDGVPSWVVNRFGRRATCPCNQGVSAWPCLYRYAFVARTSPQRAAARTCPSAFHSLSAPSAVRLASHHTVSVRVSFSSRPCVKNGQHTTGRVWHWGK